MKEIKIYKCDECAYRSCDKDEMVLHEKYCIPSIMARSEESADMKVLQFILCNHFGIPYEDNCAISEETNIVTDLGADSLDVVEIIMTIEDEMNMCFDDRESDKVFMHDGKISSILNFLSEERSKQCR